MKKLIILPLISVAFLLIGYLSALPSVEGGNVPPALTITGKTVYTAEIPNTQVTIILNEGSENQHYEFNLYAINADGLREIDGCL